MIEHFPGLRSLRAFDAAAKHLSFTKAAEVMGVTPAAISHQIKEMEDQLRITLFNRTSRSMRLTQQGEILHVAAQESIEVLTRALHRIKKLENRNQIRVTSTPSVAAKWLVPIQFYFCYPTRLVIQEISQKIRILLIKKNFLHQQMHGSGQCNFILALMALCM